ncbi:hypothetical protein [Amycolatopsis anabasis]|uniref:hypothetical protein n=1 Tax=Amycolatopsis anabasis TaxID=1840409 RepID=UPI00131DE33E|nr:hypothetical protein [Amycolatopsis anabasis]
MGNPFQGAVSWDRRGEDWIGVFHPGYLGLFRTTVTGLHRLAQRRLDEHAAGSALGRLDRRLDAVLWVRRMAESMPHLPELEVLLPVRNHLDSLLGALPDEGGVVVLHGWPDRFLWGTVALDLCVALDAWLRSWRYGEAVDGLTCPDDETLAQWQGHRDWLHSQIVVPLRPEAVTAS